MLSSHTQPSLVLRTTLMGSLVSDPPRGQSTEALALHHTHPCCLVLTLPLFFPQSAQSRDWHTGQVPTQASVHRGPASAPPGPRSPHSEPVLRNEKRAERTAQVESRVWGSGDGRAAQGTPVPAQSGLGRNQGAGAVVRVSTQRSPGWPSLHPVETLSS